MDLVKRCKKAETQNQVLRHKYQSLSDALDEAKKLLEDHRAKLRKRKDTIDTWEKYSKRQGETIKELVARLKRQQGPESSVDALTGINISHGNEILNARLPEAYSPDSSLDYNKPFSPHLATSLGRTAEIGSPKRVVSEPPPSIVPGSIFGGSPRHTASFGGISNDEDVLPPSFPDIPAQTPLKAIKKEPSSDGPEFVSARPVRKRKQGKEEPEGVRRHNIKLEHSSSSDPQVVSETHASSQAESIDFDEELHFRTPRKRRALQEARDERAGAEAHETSRPRLSRALQTDIAQAEDTPNVSSTTTYEASTSKSHEHWLSGTSPSHTGSLIVPFSRKLARPSPGSPLSHGVRDLAEDGETETVELQPALTGTNRLLALLNTPSTEPIRHLPPGSMHSPASAFVRTSTGRRTLPASYGLSTRNTTMKTAAIRSVPYSPVPSVVRNPGPKRPSILRDDKPRGRATTRDEKPLRERPVDSLRPEDFKPNPQYNDGLDYVYDEVVRGKEARAALSGCIDPNCCGKIFRHFAESEKDVVGPLLTSRVEDISLMERYLGGDAWRLGMMTREQKEETWLLAKTWDLANKFGKHRHRYSRMPTPPGFWSVDFPNTQERAEERRQAEEIRRALVIGRHREAMRSGGAWLFRDE